MFFRFALRASISQSLHALKNMFTFLFAAKHQEKVKRCIDGDGTKQNVNEKESENEAQRATAWTTRYFIKVLIRQYNKEGQVLIEQRCRVCMC